MKLLAVLTFACTLAGCVTDEHQMAETKPMTKCENVAALLSSPSATQGQTAAAMEVGRNAGCFGPSQPKTVVVR